MTLLTTILFYMCSGLAMICSLGCLFAVFTKRTVTERVASAIALAFHLATLYLFFTL